MKRHGEQSKSKKRALSYDQKLIASLPKKRLALYKAGFMREADGFPMERYTSKKEAERRHEEIVALVRKTKYRKVK